MENGKPLQGTWMRAFEEVDLINIKKPYSFPLPRWIKGLRIKEWESFYIQDDRFFLLARLSNLKFYLKAQVIIYDRETKEFREFVKKIPGGGWRLPQNLKNDSVDSRSWGFFFRIHSWLDTESVNIELNIKRKPKEPAFTAHAIFDLARGKTAPMAVSLLFSDNRSMYAYKALTAVGGDVVFGGKHIHFDPDKTSGLFCDFKGYFPYRMNSAWCTGMGFDSRNRRFGFSMGENQARESYKNNENALWIDGKLTLLPPVKITKSGGSETEWIIQDMEGMVDLVFTPVEMKRSIENMVFSSSDYEYPLGYFNGLLVSAEGEELPVRNVWGAGEKQYLRV